MSLQYVLGRWAEEDLSGILDYTVDTWGEHQATLYIDDLVELFELLCSKPEIGRRSEVLGRGLRRLEHESHVVFYKLKGDVVEIVRVLHKSRLPRRGQFLDR